VGQVTTNAIGDLAKKEKWDEGSWQKTALHGMAGAIEAAVAKGNIGVGALAGVTNEQLVSKLDDYVSGIIKGRLPQDRDATPEELKQAKSDHDELMKLGSTLLGVAVGAVASGGDLQTTAMAGSIAETATENNYLKHQQVDYFINKAKGCEARGDCQQVFEEIKETSSKQQKELVAVCATDAAACKAMYSDVATDSTAVYQSLNGMRGVDSWDIKNALLQVRQEQNEATQAVQSSMIAGQLAAKYGLSPKSAAALAGVVVGAIDQAGGVAQKVGSTVASGAKALTEKTSQANGESGANGGVNPALLNELTTNGVKFTPENVIATARSPSGQVVFLETGSPTAGLQHIIQEHGPEFASMGVSEAQIPSVVMRAVTEGKIVGYQGSGTGRPIYELTINGQTQRIAITTGNNGFIVGANPRGTGK